MGMEVIPQMVKILLLHDGCVHNGRWRAGKVDPAKVTPDSVEMLQQLAGVNRRGDRKPKWTEGVGVSSFGRMSKGLFAVVLAGVISGDRTREKSQVLFKSIGNRAHLLPFTATRGKLIRSVIQNVSIRRSRVREDFVRENLRWDTRQLKVKAEAAQIFRKHSTVEKVLARLIVGAHMNERSFETMAV
jgi:hypothetical protein